MRRDHTMSEPEVRKHSEHEIDGEEESVSDEEEDPSETDDDDDHYNTEDDLGSDRSEYDEDHEFKWLEKINVKATPTGVLNTDDQSEVAGYCHAKLIRRGQIRNYFYEELEQPSRETSLLAFDLFDRYGRLRPEFTTHPVKTGTGAWAEELDRGDILLVEEVFVKKDFRRQQLGKKMVDVLIKLVTQKSKAFYSITWPAMLSHVEREWDISLHEEEKDRMVQREDDNAAAF